MHMVLDATRPVDPVAALAAVRRIGATGLSVGRYMDAGYRSAVKVWLTKAEVSNYRSHGIGTIPIWEVGVNDVFSGRAAGKRNGEKAIADMIALGMPDAVPFWTADTDITVGSIDNALDYAIGWADAIPAGRRGCYADRDLLAAAYSAGLIDFGWQAAATSWSNGQTGPAPYVHMVQRIGYVTVGTVSCDRSDVYASVDYGQWPRPNGDIVTPEEIAAVASAAARAVWAFPIADPYPSGDANAPASSHLRWAQARAHLIATRLGLPDTGALVVPHSVVDDIDSAVRSAIVAGEDADTIVGRIRDALTRVDIQVTATSDAPPPGGGTP